ncbi:MAG: TRAP transporter substrate-binding protein [Alphaproteobacteria bacterium]
MRQWFAVAAAAAVGIAWHTGTADAQQPVRWQMASSYPGSLVTLGTGGKRLQDQVNKISGGNVQIRFNEPGALVPALEVFNSVSQGSIDAGWGATGIYTGRDISFALFSAVPFGPDHNEFMAWMHASGQKLADEIFGSFNVKVLGCGMLSPEASGWFRKPIESLDQLKGMRMRFFGLGARVMAKIGVITTNQPAGELMQALQLGTIDATEFGPPAIDVNMGFHQVAKNFYFPGWHQPASYFHIFFPKPKWDGLNDTQRAQIEVACSDNIRFTIAEGEALQFAAMVELEKRGVIFHTWKPEYIEAFKKGWDEVVAEESARSANFKKVWDDLQAFRKNYKVWSDRGYYR